MRPGRIKIPEDEGLPQIQRLLDVDAVVPSSSACSEATLASRPSTSPMCATGPPSGYSSSTNSSAGARARALSASAGNPARACAARIGLAPSRRASASRVSGRSVARTPLAYDTDLDALIQWPPLDLGLPALAEAPERLRREMVAAGLELERADDLPRLVKHKHSQRAVLRLDGHIAKVYRNDAALAEAVAALSAAEALPVRTARREAVVPDLRIAVQSLVSGDPPAGVLSAAGGAGGMLAALHRAPADGLPAEPPRDRLRRTGDSADLLSTIAPELAPRVAKLMRLLEAQMPVDRLVTSHGGFHVSQLLESAVELALIDFDGHLLRTGCPGRRELRRFAARCTGGSPRGECRPRHALRRLRSAPTGCRLVPRDARPPTSTRAVCGVHAALARGHRAPPGGRGSRARTLTRHAYPTGRRPAAEGSLREQVKVRASSRPRRAMRRSGCRRAEAA